MWDNEAIYINSCECLLGNNLLAIFTGNEYVDWFISVFATALIPLVAVPLFRLAARHSQEVWLVILALLILTGAVNAVPEFATEDSIDLLLLVTFFTSCLFFIPLFFGLLKTDAMKIVFLILSIISAFVFIVLVLANYFHFG
jgi:hypothetical protein